jgi:thioredoxin reductase
VGLAAAAHLGARNEPFVVFEAGDSIGASVRSWSHVRLFSPWKYNVDEVARQLLEETGWRFPRVRVSAAFKEAAETGANLDAYPTGGELVEEYLQPLADLAQIRPHVRLQTRVLSVTRQGFDKMKSSGRDDAPFVLRIQYADGEEADVLARAVIDASGTYHHPNPLGAGGVPAAGEQRFAEHIFYGIPDVLGRERNRYANRHVLVVGSGHSAFNAILDLATLAEDAPETTIFWAVRRQQIDHLFGGGKRDQLPARGALGGRILELLADGRVRLLTGIQVRQLVASDRGIVVVHRDGELPAVDEIISATGFRPDLSMLSELRVSIDPTVESAAELAPLIDPNVHSCGTVPPHGVDELSHPERDLYIVGVKSYGRAPNFLLLTGYEQVRSIVAALTGDWGAARDVQLILPETGVCSVDWSQNTPATAPLP